MLSVLAYITMALSGCFSVALTAPDSVEKNAVFTMSATPDKNDGAVSYQWSLDNSVISEDATYHINAINIRRTCSYGCCYG
jgi:hypothetical protein